MKTENRTVWVITALLAIVVIMQGIIIARLYRTEDTTAQERKMSLGRMDLLPDSVTNPAPRLHVPPADPFDNFSFGTVDDWDPFQEFRVMRQQMNQLFNDSFVRFRMSPDFESIWDTSVFSPNMDIEEKHGNYVIRMDIPGTDKSNISVEMNDREISVSGTVDETIEEEGQNQLRKERRNGRFSRSVTLPAPVKADEMEAEYKNGVLVITVPKTDDKSEARNIEVK